MREALCDTIDKGPHSPVPLFCFLLLITLVSVCLFMVCLLKLKDVSFKGPGVSSLLFTAPSSKPRTCSVQLLSHVWVFVTPWTVAHQASLSITNFWSLLKLMSIQSVMPSNHFILCCPLLLLPAIFPSIRVFSSESALHIRWPKYWSFSFSISSSDEYSGLISFRMDWLDLPCSPRNSQESSSTPQFKSINSSALSLLYGFFFPPLPSPRLLYGLTLTSLHDSLYN